mmetsp:Transcript_1170/g.3688  ORF Transcript_1170/g.3688 Transcript_1170/m.3688 type:complete len:299 (+) Transcript_1170:278-1174(+)
MASAAVDFSPETKGASAAHMAPVSRAPPREEAPRARNPQYPRDPMSFVHDEAAPHDLARADRACLLYLSGANRAEAFGRRAVLNGTAMPRFAPPPPPPGTGKRWDPQALATREAYIWQRTAVSATLTEHATAREYKTLEGRLRAAESASAANEVLLEMEAFLTTDPLITRIDADAARARLAAVRLPFERLVRNLWVEGPELHYDRLKGRVGELLAAEQARRGAMAAEDVRLAPFGPAREVPELVADLAVQKRAHLTRKAAAAEAARPAFKGMKVPRVKPTAVQANQRLLYNSLKARVP